MNIIFFSHPLFMSHRSMPRFTQMLAKGMEERGHTIEVWYPKAKFFNLPVPQSLKKWMGYIDQYILFPVAVRKRLSAVPKNTLLVFTDHALGPWVPLTTKRLHVIHCHDFLAQRSALGEIPENPTSKSGKQYQAFIRRGYQKGKNFISVSKNTQKDLHKFISSDVANSSVVYNGLNNSFEPFDILQSRLFFGEKTGLNLSGGYLLHVGGNQWYKNRPGVVEIYDAWRTLNSNAILPLVMIGEEPSFQLIEMCNQSHFKQDIHFITNLEDKYVRSAYAGASMFLFPSLAEGFGWPIAEAMACGCPVITTNEAPMTEVAGNAGMLIKRRPQGVEEAKIWAQESAKIVNKVFTYTDKERKSIIETGLVNAKRFDTKNALDQIEKIYLEISGRNLIA